MYAMLRLRLLLLPALLALALFTMAGCGGDGDDNADSTSTGAEAASAAGGELFTQTAHSGSLTPVQGKDDVFQLTLDDPAPDVTSFTDRPIRSASTEPLPGFVDTWSERGFNQDPPNAALVLDQEPDSADTAVFTLASPSYDATNGSVTYVATHVTGGTESLPSDENVDPPPSFGDAHLFIDPSTGTVLPLAIDLNAKRAQVALNFTPPWSVVMGTGESGIAYLVAASAGGGTLIPNRVSVTNGGSVEFAVGGGACPVTGTATVPSGVNAQVEIGNAGPAPLKNGPFSFPC
jgi:hypothetical protein